MALSEKLIAAGEKIKAFLKEKYGIYLGIALGILLVGGIVYAFYFPSENLLHNWKIIIYCLVASALVAIIEIRTGTNIFSIFAVSTITGVLAIAISDNIIEKREYDKLSIPLAKMLTPLTLNKADEIHIILAALPIANTPASVRPDGTSPGYSTGIGEALALARITDALKFLGMADYKIVLSNVIGEDKDEVEDYIKDKNILSLGGPKYNRVSKTILDKKPDLRFEMNTAKQYSGAIIDSGDNEVAKMIRGKISCGLILRRLIKHDEKEKLHMVLAGCDTAGVHIAADIITQKIPDMNINLSDDFCERKNTTIMAVFNSPIEDDYKRGPGAPKIILPIKVDTQ